MPALWPQKLEIESNFWFSLHTGTERKTTGKGENGKIIS